MEQYISKSAVVAEIEKLKGQLLRGACSSQISMETSCKEEAYNEVLSILDTLEVKEVKEEPSDNLEEEIDKELHENWYGEYINLDIFRESAKHFFELGLKAKGE